MSVFLKTSSLSSDYSEPAGTGRGGNRRISSGVGDTTANNIDAINDLCIESGFWNNPLTPPIRAFQDRAIVLHLGTKCLDNLCHTFVVFEVSGGEI